MEYKIEKLANESKVKIIVTFTIEEFNNKQEQVKNDNKELDTNAMFEETFNKLVSDTYVEILKKENIQVVSFPQISLDNMKNDGSIGYCATVDVFPTITLNTYKGLNVKKDVVSTTKEEIDNEVKASLANKFSYRNVNDPIKNGHTAVIDFTGRINGEEFKGGKAEKYSLEVGSNTFIPGFEEQMLGMNINETRFLKLKFPENYHGDLAGKDVEFEVKVHEIKEKVFPTLDDEFIKSLKIDNVETVNDYERYIENRIFVAKQNAAIEKLNQTIFDELLRLNPVVIPTSMIEKEIEYRLQAIEKQAEMYKMPLELLLQYSGIESVEKFKESYYESAKNRVHLEILLDKVVEQENIVVSDEEVENIYKQFATRQNIDVEEIKKNYPSDQVKYSYAKEKAIDLLIKANSI